MQELDIVVAAGNRPACLLPLSAAVPWSAGPCVLVDAAQGVPIPSQVVPSPQGTTVHWIVDSLAPRQERRYVLREGQSPPTASEVQVRPEGAGCVALRAGNEPVTAYLYGEGRPKPCLYPLVGPFGQGVTRAYPQETVEGDSTDHVHHRSLWTAWGDVNGSDNWGEEASSGRMTRQRLETMEGGPVLGRLAVRSDWVSADSRRLLEDRIEYRVYNLSPGPRLLDVDVTFRATDGDVRFGDTKEGGILSLRVATPMEGARTGCIENAIGGVTEAETWGRRASWCDYSGRVGDHVVGVAVLDHPGNLGYPTFWHVRDYGLMTANPFGSSQFPDGRGQDGSHVVRSGTELRFRYRVIVHAGNAGEGAVRQHYLNWVFPPTVKVEG